MSRPHACNSPLTCPECIRRFWQWVESHTRGRRQGYVVCHPDGTRERHELPGFYGHAATFIEVDARSRR